MLHQRILHTVRFFDLQQYPLTAFEIYKYLVSDPERVKPHLDSKYELNDPLPVLPVVSIDTILIELEDCVKKQLLVQQFGFFALPGREGLVSQRLRSYSFGIFRERRIRRYILAARHIPFIRGLALAGSQALGLARQNSDIDLLIITHSRFMWLGRTLLTTYFQVLGIRRYSLHIANRFCLNHYLAKPREVDAERNLYKAMEYTKLRPLIYEKFIKEFQQANLPWIQSFFPQVKFDYKVLETQSIVQKALEWLCDNSVGRAVEQMLGKAQLKRIRQSEYIFVRVDELSFHPESKHEALLESFFQSP